MCSCVRVDEEIEVSSARWKVVAAVAARRSPSKPRRRQSCTTHTNTTGLPPPSKNSSRESNPVVVVRARGGVDRRRRRSSGKTHRSGEIHTAAVRGRTRAAYLHRFFICRQTVVCCATSPVSVTGLIVSRQRIIQPSKL